MPRTRSSGRRTARSQNPYSQMDRPPSKDGAFGKGRKYASENERPDPSSFANSAGQRRLPGSKYSQANPVIGTTGKRTTGPFPQGGPKVAHNQQGAAPLGSSFVKNFQPLLAKTRAAKALIKLPKSSPKLQGNSATGEQSYNPARGALVGVLPAVHTAETKRKKQPNKSRNDRMLNPGKMSIPDSAPKETGIKLLNTK